MVYSNPAYARNMYSVRWDEPVANVLVGFVATMQYKRVKGFVSDLQQSIPGAVNILTQKLPDDPATWVNIEALPPTGNVGGEGR